MFLLIINAACLNDMQILISCVCVCVCGIYKKAGEGEGVCVSVCVLVVCFLVIVAGPFGSCNCCSGKVCSG